MAKARKQAKRRKTSTKRTAKRKARPRKTNKPKQRSKSVTKSKKRSFRQKISIIDRIPILKNKTVQRVGFGLGMGSLAGLAASVIPVPIIQNNREIINTGVAFATEPLSGVVRLALSGGLGQLSNLFGNLGGNSSNGAQAQNAGFA